MGRAIAVHSVCGLLAVAAVTMLADNARADRAFLVGGSVIEGNVTRSADKVMIEVESGEITVPAEVVLRIEKTESVVSHFQALYAALHPHDVKARFALANYCREHDMRSKERQLLQEFLGLTDRMRRRTPAWAT